jgi:hypothetical protein
MAHNKNFIIVLLLLVCACTCMAQDDNKALPLKTILDNIATQHQVKFSFIEDDIAIYSMIPPKADWPFDQKITYLRDNTRLQFKAVSAKYFSVYNDWKIGKPLCAYLIDATSGAPIESAVISIENTAISATSDAKGYFELPVKSATKILVRHLGYERQDINPATLYTVNCPVIGLVPILEQVDEVLTQRFLTTGITKNLDGTYEVKPRRFGILPGLTTPDVLQTMQQLPGVYSTDETISNINVRGGTHDQNLFLWNGIRMFQTGHFFGLISSFNPSLAQNISIYKNGSSAFYGESVSSIVDISSHAKTLENRNTISANLISAEGYSKIKLGNEGSLEVSARRSFTDFFDSATYQKYSDRIFQNTIVTNINDNETVDFHSDEDFYFYDLSTQYQQKIGKHELFVDLIGIRNSLRINQVSDSEDRNSRLGQQNYGGNIGWQTDWSEKNTSKIHFFTSYYNLDAKNESIQSGQILTQGNTVMDWGFELKDSHRLSDKIMLNAGYQFDEIGVTNLDEINTPSFSRNVKEVLLTHALIGEGIYKSLNRATFLQLGFRANYYVKFNQFVPEPRLQFSQALSHSIRMEILGEQKSQTLSQIIDLQHDFLGLEKRRWSLANENNIPIQKSSQLSLGFSYKSKKWLVTIDNFYKKVLGITSSGQGFQNQFEYTRAIGDYRVLGTELFVQRTFKSFYTWLCYSYNDNEYTFDQFSASAFANNFELPHTLSWAGIYEWHQVKVALGSKWHSGRPLTTPASNVVDTSDPGNLEIIYNHANNSHLNRG